MEDRYDGRLAELIDEVKTINDACDKFNALRSQAEEELDKALSDLEEARLYKEDAQKVEELAQEVDVLRGRFEDAQKTAQELRAKNTEQSAMKQELREKVDSLLPLAQQAERYRAVIERVGKVSRHKGALQVLCKCGAWHSKKTDRIECDCGQVYTREDVKATQ